MKYARFALLAALIAAGCSSNRMMVVKINRTIDSVRAVFAPDHRAAVFSVTVQETGSRFILHGETDNPKAKSALLARLREDVTADLVDSVVTLPEASLGTMVYGIVDVSVGNLRSRPKYQAELVSQVLLGHTVTILKADRDWYYVKTAGDYLGWIEPGNIFPVDSATLASYEVSHKLIVTSVFSKLSTMPGDKGTTVSDLVMADLLKPVRKAGTAYLVELPDGRTGFVRSSDVEDFDRYAATHKPTPGGIVAVAKELLGFPYVWGGTSVKGVDCSGFTKTVFRMNGITLPRDADQQVDLGKNIDPGPDFTNLRTGDLLFFGDKAEGGKPKKIVHVAIYLGHGYFIQASNRVRISSLVKGDSAFDQYDLDRFVRAKRILPTRVSG